MSSRALQAPTPPLAGPVGQGAGSGVGARRGGERLRRGTHGHTDRSQGERAEQDARQSGIAQIRALCAELLGTFALVLVGAGVEVIPAALHLPVNDILRYAAPGMTVMAMIYSLGDVSGAHINPAVTLAFALRRVFPWRRVPGYLIAQLVGALLAAGLLRALFGLAGGLGVTRPHTGTGTTLVIEIVLTVFLVLVILGTADGSRLVGSNAGLAVGTTIALDGFFGGPVSGASMNPARSLGPALVSGSSDSVWIYVVGPLAGALIAVAVIWTLRGAPPAHEAEAAMGEQSEKGSGRR